MKELIVEEHAIKRGRERIPGLEGLSAKGIAVWFKENVPFAEKIPWGSKLYLSLNKVYNKQEEEMVYLKDDFGIYIIEDKKFEWYLHSVQEPNFRKELKVKLKLHIGKKKLAKLIELRDYLPQREIPDIVA